MKEELIKFIGKKVHVTFKSKRHNRIYNLTGALLRTNEYWSLFEEFTTDYPSIIDGPTIDINTSRIRSVEAV